jgi:peptide deformylase
MEHDQSDRRLGDSVRLTLPVGIPTQRRTRGKAADPALPGPSERMAAIGIVQQGDPILGAVAREFELPREAERARQLLDQLSAVSERASRLHRFAKGMGLAAPQIGVGRRAALVRTAAKQIFALVNPRVVEESSDLEEQYEGCLSFFDVRGMVTRPVTIRVRHQDLAGDVLVTTFEYTIARLVGHEIDHLDGRLYPGRMAPDAKLVPIAQYDGTGRRWIHRAASP